MGFELGHKKHIGQPARLSTQYLASLSVLGFRKNRTMLVTCEVQVLLKTFQPSCSHCSSLHSVISFQQNGRPEERTSM